ncbi:glycosyltransferase family 2 protein [Adhaeribacter terreus]|uniref:Glycosyltransferase family 2 protein n=1 Tax=Adhaeribacter terreus TaxID=529703 RepID=A0ABW0E909_9BACT
MDIIIKSFNRPYYLERCLRSIYKYIEGNFKIHVLDDGTPPEYLERIAQLFPEVTITLSGRYDDKVKSIHSHIAGETKFDQLFIPTKLWIDQVKKSSDIFLLLEDDFWLVAPIKLDEVKNAMIGNNIVLTKLYWGSSLSNFKATIKKLNTELEETIPEIPSIPVSVLRLIFHNKFKINSILYRLGLIKDGIYFQLPFYSLYSVASAFFDKRYWLFLWENDQLKADETFQLLKATTWFRKHKSRYAKAIDEKVKTSFITSATNTYKDIDLDIFTFNHCLNQAWLNGDLDPMANFPVDFSPESIKPILEKCNYNKCSYSEWLRYIARFKSIYQSMGVKTD